MEDFFCVCSFTEQRWKKCLLCWVSLECYLSGACNCCASVIEKCLYCISLIYIMLPLSLLNPIKLCIMLFFQHKMHEIFSEIICYAYWAVYTEEKFAWWISRFHHQFDCIPFLIKSSICPKILNIWKPTPQWTSSTMSIAWLPQRNSPVLLVDIIIGCLVQSFSSSWSSGHLPRPFFKSFTSSSRWLK